MENLILGLLMIRRFTAYELHILIKNNYQAICSDSIGNIQRALKKLEAAGQATMENSAESGVKKKIFTITPLGRTQFLEWLNQPIDINKAKNMEIGRMLCLGFLSPEERLSSVEGQIENLKAEYDYLMAVHEVVSQNQDLSHYLEYFKDQKEFTASLLASLQKDDVGQVAKDVNYFGTLTLKFGLDTTKFYLDWFLQMRKEMLYEQD